MASQFPTQLDDFANPSASGSLSNPSHAQQHSDLNDAVEALEAKVGVNSSAVPSSLDYKVAQAQSTADGAATSASTAQSTANSAQSTANSAATTAGNAATAAATAQAEAESKIAEVSEDTTPSLGGDLAVGDNEIQQNTLPQTDHSAVGFVTNVILSGETMAAMQLLELDAIGRWFRTNADFEIESNGMLAISIEEGVAATPLKVALPGSYVRDDNWSWTPNAPLYVGRGTRGTITATPPSGTGDVVRIIGYAVTATVIFLNPSNEYSVIA